jgi:hypothetical protein
MSSVTQVLLIIAALCCLTVADELFTLTSNTDYVTNYQLEKISTTTGQRNKIAQYGDSTKMGAIISNVCTISRWIYFTTINMTGDNVILYAAKPSGSFAYSFSFPSTVNALEVDQSLENVYILTIMDKQATLTLMNYGNRTLDPVVVIPDATPQIGISTFCQHGKRFFFLATIGQTPVFYRINVITKQIEVKQPVNYFASTIALDSSDDAIYATIFSDKDDATHIVVLDEKSFDIKKEIAKIEVNSITASKLDAVNKKLFLAGSDGRLFTVDLKTGAVTNTTFSNSLLLCLQ